jgi:hypothetical protein
MNLGTARLRGRPRNRWQDEVSEDGRLVGRKGILTFRLLMCTFGRVGSSFELFQCVLLVEVKASTLKVQFVSLSAHRGNAETLFDICGVINF